MAFPGVGPFQALCVVGPGDSARRPNFTRIKVLHPVKAQDSRRGGDWASWIRGSGLLILISPGKPGTFQHFPQKMLFLQSLSW